MISQIINNENKSVPIRNTRFFNYEYLEYTIIGYDGDLLYGVKDSDDGVYKSLDGGKTWEARRLYTLPAKLAKCGGTYANGVINVWLSDGRIIRTDNEFSTTLTTKTGVYPPIVPNGIARSKRDSNKLMFVEYTTIEESIDLNVYYSNDNGATWKSVMTKNHPSDIWHFHSVDFINSINGKEEWLVTTGDSGKDVRWYSSNNDGTSWRQIVGNFSDEEGAQKFRTLGVRLIAPETYIWSSDSNSENYVFACPRSNMNIYNLIKVQSLNAQAWGMNGGKDWLVTCDKVESSTYEGRYTNRILISGDGGGSWYKEYEFESLQNIEGVNGVQGPDKNGCFYVRITSPIQGTIKMTPRKELSYPMKPLNQVKVLKDYKKEIIKNKEINTSTSLVVDLLETDVYEPVILIQNLTDVNARLMVFDTTNGTRLTQCLGSTDIVISPNQSIYIDKNDGLFKNILPKGSRISLIASGENSTTGGVYLTLFGKCYSVADHRCL
ncbi:MULTISPECIES: hypothetical protein [Clostridium]|jgi:hypothetical protein|uniref:hypothetical protein n=1 Tax=Clostridium TaxID=1485 RepID=UPI00189BCF5E|nr:MULTISPECIES: hypothetical protein [Clostridium]MDB2122395.1 hypothetical protein [Clostridium paraputrificum]MDC0803477.1 hypothetical protein [Clostridium paraputrificum]MDU1586139.1 hypothetical protein [Clostridium sp.]DAU43712.1 MAG TPA: hypothetical protein [Caudoviricetes sp.]